MALEFLNGLPGWEVVLFVGLFIVFIISGLITTLWILNRLRWPFTYVVLENVAGKGFSISKKGRARLISFGDGGEEVYFLKNIKKYRVAYGKRIGPKQIGWAIDKAGYWYNFSFGDLDEKLLELGVMPQSVDVRLAMSSMRKGLKGRLEEKGAWEKYGAIMMIGTLLISIFVFAGMSWYMSNKQIELAQIQADSNQKSTEVLQQVSNSQNTLNSILDRLTNVVDPTGSGIIIDNTGGTNINEG